MAMEVAAVNESLPISHEESSVLGVDGSHIKKPAASLSIEAPAGNGGQHVPCNNSTTSPDYCKQISEVSQMLTLELEEAEVLFQKGCDALNVNEFVEAVDCFSRALEIRVKHHGELAPECLSTYYLYGRALFCKSIEDYDPFVEDESASTIGETSDIPPSATVDVQGEAGKTCEVPVTNTEKSSQALVTNAASVVPAHGDTRVTSDIREPQASQTLANSGTKGDASGHNEDENQEKVPNDDGIEVESEDEEPDMDLAWKMFDIVRVIVERNQQADDTFRMVEVYTALGDVSLQRDNFEASFDDYCKALSYLEGAVRSDSRHIAELCYKICVALECADKVTEALMYGQRAVSVCESSLHRIKNKIVALSNGGGASSNKVTSYTKQMGVIRQLLIDYKEKVDELQRLVLFPRYIESVPSSEEKNMIKQEINSCTGGIFKDLFESPDASSSSSTNIIDLGIVGRGIKRASIPV